MMLAAIEAVTKANAIGRSQRHDTDVAAQATALETIHAAPPLVCVAQVRWPETVGNEFANPMPVELGPLPVRAEDFDVSPAKLRGFKDRLAAAAAWRAGHGAGQAPPFRPPPATAIRATLSRPNLCWAAVSALCSAQMPSR